MRSSFHRLTARKTGNISVGLKLMLIEEGGLAIRSWIISFLSFKVRQVNLCSHSCLIARYLVTVN